MILERLKFLIAHTGLLLLFAGASSTRDAYADFRSDRELKIKAAFLYKFTKFISWPENLAGRLHQPVTICIIGQDPFRGSLEKISVLEPASNHSIRVLAGKTIDDLDDCHLAYLDSESATPAVALVEAAQKLNIVTVSDRRDFLASGGIIELFVEGNNVFFRINLAQAQRENIRISSRLLTLAKAVIME